MSDEKNYFKDFDFIGWEEEKTFDKLDLLVLFIHDVINRMYDNQKDDFKKELKIASLAILFDNIKE